VRQTEVLEFQLNIQEIVWHFKKTNLDIQSLIIRLLLLQSYGNDDDKEKQVICGLINIY
jgi:hypothetical protein